MSTNWQNVKSWEVEISETASVRPDENGSYWSLTHGGSGTLKRMSPGYYSGVLQFHETKLQVDRVSAPTITKMSGTETWEIALETGGDGYTLSVNSESYSGTVAGVTKTEEPNPLVQPYSFTFFVEWALFDSVQGSFGNGGAIKGQVLGTLEQNDCTGSLTWALRPSGSSSSPDPVGGGTPLPTQSPKPAPDPKPKKPKKKHTFPVPVELLPKLAESAATAADARAYEEAAAKTGCQRCLLQWIVAWRHTAHDEIPESAWDELDAIYRKTCVPERYYCADHPTSLRAGVALYWALGPSIAGHTAWAVEMPKVYRDFYKGSAYDFGPWMTGTFGGLPPFFVRQGLQEIIFPPSPQERFKFEGYSFWKSLRAPHENFEGAMLEACNTADAGYDLAMRNCIDVTYAILTIFGVAGLPETSDTILPFVWYWEIDGVPTELKKLSPEERAALDTLLNGPQSTLPRAAPFTTALQLKKGGALHLNPACPALPEDRRKLQAIPVGVYRGADALTEEFGALVCEKCLQHIRSDSQVVYEANSVESVVRIYPDCVSVYTLPGIFSSPKLTEIPLGDIRQVQKHFRIPLTTGQPLVIVYDVFFPNGTVTSGNAELKFQTEEDREKFVEELNRIKGTRSRV